MITHHPRVIPTLGARLATLGARLAVLALIAAALLGGGAVAHGATSHHPTVSFSQAQQQFNCVLCHEPLVEARSSEAYEENTVLRGYIAQGDTMAEIKHAMVANYGVAVLANPPKRGFAVLIVVVPVVVIVLGVLTLLYTIPRWRRRAATQSRDQDDAPPTPEISDTDAARLAADLASRD